MSSLMEKQVKMLERKRMLENSIQELKESITEESFEKTSNTIQAKAAEIQKLESQLELTSLVIKNTEEKLKKRADFENSKEYIDKRKTQNRLIQEAREQARKIHGKMLAIMNEIQEVNEKVKHADSIHLQLAENQVEAVFSIQERKQPFTWLKGLSEVLEGKKQEMRRMQKRGEI